MIKFIIFCLLFTGCTVTQKPIERKSRPPQKDWLRIYEEEIMIAIQNQDKEAHYFFVQELIREKRRLYHEGIIEIKPIPDYAK